MHACANGPIQTRRTFRILKCDCLTAMHLLSVGYTTDRTGENRGLSRLHALSPRQSILRSR